MSLPGEIKDPFPPATFSAANARSVNYPNVLVVVTCGRYEPVWKLDNGFSYQAPCQSSRPGASAPQYGYAEQVQGVNVNGIALTGAVSQRFVQVNKGYYYLASNPDLMTATLYISMPDGSNPMARGNVVEVMLSYQFCSTPTDDAGAVAVAGPPWLPWILSLPSLTNKIDAQFGGITQIGGGSIVLDNTTKFFDSRVKQNWDAGQVRVYMGYDGLASYTLLATFIAANVSADDSTFTINTKDPKILVDVLFPSKIYDNVTYPNIDPAFIGKPIPMAYGKILGVEPATIDTVNGIFKVAQHAIYSFDGVRVLDTTTGLWVTVPFASTNTATGQFTLAVGSSWTAGQSVAVDFTGRLAAGTTGPMLNPADIVKDILTQLGVTTNTSVFNTIRNYYTIGYYPGVLNSDGSQAYAYCRKPSLYLDSQQKALTTIQQIMQDTRSYLSLLPDGSFGMFPFTNYQASTLPVITDENTLSMSGVKVDGSGTAYALTQTGMKPTQVQVTYAQYGPEGYQSTVTANSAFNQNTRNIPVGASVPLVIDTTLTDVVDAQYVANAALMDWHVDPYIYTVQVSWLAWGLLAGAQHVHLTSAIHNWDLVSEILAVKMDLTNFVVTLTLGNLRGYEQSSGFWSNSGDTTPSGATLAWPQQGETVAPFETEYRRHQTGHWHGSDDLAVDSTNGANSWDWRDYTISRWQ